MSDSPVVEVVVRHGATYDGHAAGETLLVTRREAEMNRGTLLAVGSPEWRALKGISAPAGLNLRGGVWWT